MRVPTNGITENPDLKWMIYDDLGLPHIDEKPPYIYIDIYIYIHISWNHHFLSYDKRFFADGYPIVTIVQLNITRL